MQRAFSGSAKALVLAALKSGISKKEREEIEDLLKGEDNQHKDTQHKDTQQKDNK
jgi:hypothetical protein